MKKLIFGKRVTIALSAAVCSFSVITAATSTYAWFASNSAVTATGMSVTLSTSELIQDYEVFNVTATDDTNMYFSTDDTKNNLTIGQLSDLNLLHAALVKVHLKKDSSGNDYENLSLTVQTQTTTYLGATDAPYFGDDDFDDYAKYSSVGEFYFANTCNLVSGKYVTPKVDFEAKHSLVNEYQTALVDGLATTLKTGFTGEYMYFIMDYSLNSIAKIYSHNLGRDEPEGGVQYSIDITFNITLGGN